MRRLECTWSQIKENLVSVCHLGRFGLDIVDSGVPLK